MSRSMRLSSVPQGCQLQGLISEIRDLFNVFENYYFEFQGFQEFLKILEI